MYGFLHYSRVYYRCEIGLKLDRIAFRPDGVVEGHIIPMMTSPRKIGGLLKANVTGNWHHILDRHCYHDSLTYSLRLHKTFLSNHLVIVEIHTSPERSTAHSAII